MSVHKPRILKICRNIIIISTWIFPYQFIFSQGYLSPQQAVGIALQNNYSIRVARNNVQVAENNVSLGNAGFLPTVDVRAGADKSVQDSRQEFINGQISDRTNARSNSRQAEVALNWSIFDGFKMFVSYSRLQEFQDLGEINAKITIENTVTQVMNIYYDVVQQKKKLDFVKETVEYSKERLEIARTNYEIGAGSRLDILQARVDLNADSAALLQQQTAYRQAKVHLNELLARDVNTEFMVGDIITLQPTLDLGDLQASAMEQSSEILAAQKNSKIAKLDLKELRSEWLPDIQLTSNYQWTQFESESGFLLQNKTSGYTYGVNLSLNLFNGFNTRRKIQNAKIDVRNRELEFQKTLTRVSAQLASTYQDYQKSLKQVSLEQENLEVARENLTISLEQFRIGSINSLQLREAQQNYLDAESRLISARFRAKQAENDLLRLSGKLIEGHLDVSVK